MNDIQGHKEFTLTKANKTVMITTNRTTLRKDNDTTKIKTKTNNTNRTP